MLPAVNVDDSGAESSDVAGTVAAGSASFSALPPLLHCLCAARQASLRRQHVHRQGCLNLAGLSKNS